MLTANGPATHGRRRRKATRDPGRLTLVLLALLVTAAPACEAAEPDPAVPGHNIVVLVADDVGVDLVGAYDASFAGHPDPVYRNTTPSLDYLARTGIRFTGAWTDPVCSPSRSQMLTGKHGLHSGIGRIVQRSKSITTGRGLQPGHDTIPSLLRSAPAARRYSTAAVGKWHLSDRSFHPPDDGAPIHPLGNPDHEWFEVYAGTMYNLGSGTYNRWTKTFGTPIDLGTDECSAESNFCKATVTDYATADTADDAIHLIRTLREPFFLFVAFNAVHLPFDAPAKPLQPASCLNGRIQGATQCNFEGNDASKARCMMQWLDNEIGRVLCALEDGPDKPRAPTTTVFLSDNGTMSEATVSPFRPEHAKGTLYQGGIQIPFIVKSPHVSDDLVGKTTDALVTSTDLFATIAKIAGIAEPADPLELRDSISFLPVLEGTAGSARKYAYAEKFRNNFVPTAQGQPPKGYVLDLHEQAIRDRTGFKLIQRVGRSRQGGVSVEDELYQVSLDPHEHRDLMRDARAGKEPAASHYARLLSELTRRYPHLLTPAAPL